MSNGFEGLVRDARHGRSIARVEFVRSVRKVLGSRGQLFALALTAAFVLPLTVFLALQAHRVGVGVRAGTPAAQTTVRAQPTVVAVASVSWFAVRTATRLNSVERETLLLSVTSPRAIVFGLLGAECARLAANFGLSALVVLAAFALGADSPLTFVVAPASLLPVVVAAAVVGYLVGLGIVATGRELPVSSRVKAVVLPAAFVLLFVASQVVPRLFLDGSGSLPTEAIRRSVAASPLSSYGDVLLLGTQAAPTIRPTAAVVAAGFAAVVPAGLVAAERIARRLWDPTVESGVGSERRTSAATGRFGPGRPPRPFRWSKSGRIGWFAVLRVSRSPGRAVHLVPVLVFLVSALAPLLQLLDPERAVEQVLRFAPLLIPVVGAVLGGAVACLNPLGDEESMLSTLVLTATDPVQFVRGRLIAALCFGLPVATVLPAVLGSLGSLSPVTTTIYAAFGAALTLVSGGIGLGLGSLVPQFKSVSTLGVEGPRPSVVAIGGHALSVTGLGLVGAFLLLDRSTSGLVLLGVYVLLAVGLAWGGYRYAARRFRTYAVE